MALLTDERLAWERFPAEPDPWSTADCAVGPRGALVRRAQPRLTPTLGIGPVVIADESGLVQLGSSDRSASEAGCARQRWHSGPSGGRAAPRCWLFPPARNWPDTGSRASPAGAAWEPSIARRTLRSIARWR